MKCSLARQPVFVSPRDCWAGDCWANYESEFAAPGSEPARECALQTALCRRLATPAPRQLSEPARLAGASCECRPTRLRPSTANERRLRESLAASLFPFAIGLCSLNP